MIHYEQRRVQVAARPAQLTATEFDFLRVLSVNAGQVLTNEALLRQVWGGRDAWTRLGWSSCVSSSSTTSPTANGIRFRNWCIRLADQLEEALAHQTVAAGASSFFR